MKRIIDQVRPGRIAGAVISVCAAVCAVPMPKLLAEDILVVTEDETWISETAEDGADESWLQENVEDAARITGTYTVEDGWVQIPELGTDEETVYKQSGYETSDTTSTMTFSYLDTNYSVFEYEQLRDMLTNNLVYSNVNAQISASAVYTDAKDYLYILVCDDSAKDYRELYYYVVGDHRCFSIEVQEYRAEMEALKAADQETPGEAGQKIAQKFVWNTAG